MRGDSEQNSQRGVSEEEVQEESSKIAKQATEAHDKATELMQAAAAAGDPEERQKLMEEALQQQIQSGSLGKTAKYLRSGTFQGMAVGAGLGIAPGASLGTITGTLVGGVSSTALGGLGAGLGAATGALHGPFWDLGKGAGKGIQKITGNLPGWKATEDQKKQLEKMVGQINGQEAPSQDELKQWGNGSVGKNSAETPAKDHARLPSVASKNELGLSSKSYQNMENKEGQVVQNENRSEAESKVTATAEGSKAEDVEPGNNRQDSHDARKGQGNGDGVHSSPNSQEERSGTSPVYKDASIQTEQEGRKKPRKLHTRSENDDEHATKPKNDRRQPRKLEKRGL